MLEDVRVLQRQQHHLLQLLDDCCMTPDGCPPLRDHIVVHLPGLWWLTCACMGSLRAVRWRALLTCRRDSVVISAGSCSCGLGAAWLSDYALDELTGCRLGKSLEFGQAPPDSYLLFQAERAMSPRHTATTPSLFRRAAQYAGSSCS